MKIILFITLLIINLLMSKQAALAQTTDFESPRASVSPKNVTRPFDDQLQEFYYNSGVIGTGGGDAILCNDKKFYSLDYVATEGGRDVAEIHRKANKAIEILFSIYIQLSRTLNYSKSSYMNHINGVSTGKFSLFNFIQLNNNPSKVSKYDTMTTLVNTNGQPFLWLPGWHTLIDIHDESLLRNLEKCTLNVRKSIYQAVIMKKLPNSPVVQYRSSSMILEQLEKTSPVQLSFLYLHEWLRIYIDDAEVIRDVNRFLHSDIWFNFTEDQMRRSLESLGWSYRFESTKSKIIFNQSGHEAPK